MPEKKTLARARADKKAGKSASTQAGEFVREEMDHIREGKHGARNPKQAIAIGLSKARRAGVELKAPGKGRGRAKTSATHAKPSARRSAAASKALKREPKSSASHAALSRHAKQAASTHKRQAGR